MSAISVERGHTHTESLFQKEEKKNLLSIYLFLSIINCKTATTTTIEFIFDFWVNRVNGRERERPSKEKGRDYRERQGREKR